MPRAIPAMRRSADGRRHRGLAARGRPRAPAIRRSAPRRAEEPCRPLPASVAGSRHEARGMLHTVAVASRPRGRRVSRDRIRSEALGRVRRALRGTAHKLMLSPLLPLLAFRLVELAGASPRSTPPSSTAAATSTDRSTSDSRCRSARRSISPWCGKRRRWTRRNSSTRWAKCSATRWRTSCARAKPPGPRCRFPAWRGGTSAATSRSCRRNLADRRPRRAQDTGRRARRQLRPPDCSPASTSRRCCRR